MILVNDLIRIRIIWVVYDRSFYFLYVIKIVIFDSYNFKISTEFRPRSYTICLPWGGRTLFPYHQRSTIYNWNPNKFRQEVPWYWTRTFLQKAVFLQNVFDNLRQPYLYCIKANYESINRHKIGLSKSGDISCVCVAHCANIHSIWIMSAWVCIQESDFFIICPKKVFLTKYNKENM